MKWFDNVPLKSLCELNYNANKHLHALRTLKEIIFPSLKLRITFHWNIQHTMYFVYPETIFNICTSGSLLCVKIEFVVFVFKTQK